MELELLQKFRTSGLKLFVLDVVDIDTNLNFFYYILAENETEAEKISEEEMNSCFYRYSFYLNEEEDEDEIIDFLERYEVKKGIFFIFVY